MSWKKHQTTSFRKLITIDEWAEYTGLNRNTILNKLKKYRLVFTYEPRDIYSVFDFLLFLLKKSPRSRNKVEAVSGK
jgi:hypothetical protein